MLQRGPLVMKKGDVTMPYLRHLFGALIVTTVITGLLIAQPKVQVKDDKDVSVTPGLNVLEPLLPQLREALLAGDIDLASSLATRLTEGLHRIRSASYRREASLERAEKLAFDHPAGRANLLPWLAMAALEAGDDAKAESYAHEALDAVSSSKQPDFDSDRIYYGNHVLGMMAIHRNDVSLAKQYLIASAKTPGTWMTRTRGPNTSLAKALLERGERDVVLQYLDLCKGFWKENNEPLEQWRTTLRGGGNPDFGISLNRLP